MSNWTLLSNHGHVLVCLSRDPEARLRDVAADVGITERAVQKIVRDLQDGGMVSVTKSGRRNSYRIHKNQTLRHPLEADCTLGELIKIVNRQPEATPAVAAPSGRTGVKAESAAGAAARDAGPDRQGDRPKAARPATSKKTGTQESNSSESHEKQQGSLF